MINDTTPQEYLRQLREKLRHVPGTYDIDDYDLDQLTDIANKIDEDFDFGGEVRILAERAGQVARIEIIGNVEAIFDKIEQAFRQ